LTLQHRGGRAAGPADLRGSTRRRRVGEAGLARPARPGLRPGAAAQIICARLKLLAMPPPRAGEDGLAPNILAGTWVPAPDQRRLWPRLRCARASRRMRPWLTTS
jgi:hypothetical protein